MEKKILRLRGAHHVQIEWDAASKACYGSDRSYLINYGNYKISFLSHSNIYLISNIDICEKKINLRRYKNYM